MFGLHNYYIQLSLAKPTHSSGEGGAKEMTKAIDTLCNDLMRLEMQLVEQLDVCWVYVALDCTSYLYKDRLNTVSVGSFHRK